MTYFYWLRNSTNPSSFDAILRNNRLPESFEGIYTTSYNFTFFIDQYLCKIQLCMYWQANKEKVFIYYMYNMRLT